MGIEPTKTTLGRWKTLVEKLRYATSQNAIDWSEGTRSDSITTEVSNRAITIRKVSADYHVSVSDLFGEPIDSFTDVQLENLTDGTPAFFALSELFGNVKRKLTGADEVLDEILEALPDLPPRR